MEHKKPQIPEEDDNREPVIIENDYLLKSELTSRIALLFFFGWLISISLAPEPDPLNELYRKLALGTAIIGVIWTVISEMKMLLGLLKNRLYIKIYKDKIEYEYINNAGKKMKLIIDKKDYQNVSWSIMPVFGEINKILDERKTINEKLEYAIGFLPRVIINMFFWLIYYSINFFKIKKYIVVATKDYIIAIPQDKKLKKLIPDVGGFEKLTLLHSLTIKNSKILQGGYYARQ